MRKYLLHILILLFVFLYPQITQHAEESRGIVPVHIKDKQGKQVGMYKGSHALVVGVSDYTAGWPDLESIPGEIEQVEESLIEIGFNVEKIMNPDSEKLKKAYEKFIESAGIKERIFEVLRNLDVNKTSIV